jgi:hypothetical protein
MCVVVGIVVGLVVGVIADDQWPFLELVW